MKFKAILMLATTSLIAAACSRNKEDALTIPLQPVSRQTIVVQAEATGVVEPINVIEVKAKSSGQIVAMPVETGTFVKPGDLLVQLDTRDTRNAYAQAKADLDAANVNLRVAKQSKDRADELYKDRIITAVEHEAAQVGYANAQATVLRNRAALDIRLQNLQEATVRAPVAGTVIEKDVALGQVIASGTGTFGGGTTILKMADLTKVRVRALVNETDIGKVKAGQTATVTVTLPASGVLVLVILAVLAALMFASLGIGFVVSLLSLTTSQAVQYSMLVLLFSIFFSGFFLDLRLMWDQMRVVAYAIPATYALSMLQEVMEAVGRFSPWYKQPTRAFGLTSVRDPSSLRAHWLLAPEAAQRWGDILEQLCGVIRRYSGLIQAMLLVDDLMGDISGDDPCVTARCACWPPRSVQLRKSVLDKAEIICENCLQPFLERV